MKRMTLLARKESMSNSDFRSYWAGPTESWRLKWKALRNTSRTGWTRCCGHAAACPPKN